MYPFDSKTLSCTTACFVPVSLREFFFTGRFLVQMRVCVVEFFFSCVFSWTSSFFLWKLSWSSACLRGRVCVFLAEFFFSWTLACLLFFTFFFSFINSQPCFTSLDAYHLYKALLWDSIVRYGSRHVHRISPGRG